MSLKSSISMKDNGFLNGKPTPTPMVPSVKLVKDDGSPRVDSTAYRQLVGKLLYLATTQPDICFAVRQLSQFLEAPTQAHLQAAHRILRYLKDTSGQEWKEKEGVKEVAQQQWEDDWDDDDVSDDFSLQLRRELENITQKN